MLLLLLACVPGTAPPVTSLDSGLGDSGDPVGAETCLDQPDVTWAGWADGFFQTYCRACHSESTAERNGAPAELDFDAEAQVIEHAERIRSAVLERGTMPTGGGVYDDDLTLLDVYLACEVGAP